MHFPLSFCKNASPTFSMVHLLHRLYGVDAPEGVHSRHEGQRMQNSAVRMQCVVVKYRVGCDCLT